MMIRLTMEPTLSATFTDILLACTLPLIRHPAVALVIHHVHLVIPGPFIRILT